MNKLVTALIVILVTLSIALVLFYPLLDLQNQNSELKNQIAQLENEKKELEDRIDELEDRIEDLANQIFQKKLSAAKEVKITGVRVDWSDDGHPSTFISQYPVYVGIKNYGDSAVEGLTVAVGTSWSKVDLQAGEKRTVTCGIFGGIMGGYNNPGFATLEFHGVILDKQDY